MNAELFIARRLFIESGEQKFLSQKIIRIAAFADMSYFMHLYGI